MIEIQQQLLPKNIICEAKKFRLRKLEKDLADTLIGVQDRDMIICPVCAYQNKAGKGTCRVHKDSRGFTIKCFACGIWKRI